MRRPAVASDARPGKIRAQVEEKARPCVRLARFATWLARKASARASSAGSAAGWRKAARKSGSAPSPACQIASRAKRRKSLTSPACWAASRPQECANPPVGNAESASCKSLHIFIRRCPSRGGRVSSDWFSEQAIELRERKGGGRLAAQQHPVCAHLVRLGIDLHRRQRVVELHV